MTLDSVVTRTLICIDRMLLSVLQVAYCCSTAFFCLLACWFGLLTPFHRFTRARSCVCVCLAESLQRPGLGPTPHGPVVSMDVQAPGASSDASLASSARRGPSSCLDSSPSASATDSEDDGSSESDPSDHYEGEDEDLEDHAPHDERDPLLLPDHGLPQPEPLEGDSEARILPPLCRHNFTHRQRCRRMAFEEQANWKYFNCVHEAVLCAWFFCAKKDRVLLDLLSDPTIGFSCVPTYQRLKGIMKDPVFPQMLFRDFEGVEGCTASRLSLASIIRNSFSVPEFCQDLATVREEVKKEQEVELIVLLASANVSHLPPPTALAQQGLGRHGAVPHGVRSDRRQQRGRGRVPRRFCVPQQRSGRPSVRLCQAGRAPFCVRQPLRCGQ